MKRNSKTISVLLAALLSVGLLVGCSTSDMGQASNTHLNFGIYNFSDSLDPATNVNSSWCGVRYGITECLFRFNEQVVAEPNLCDSYIVSDDYTVWTLHIREGVQFSNGNHVTPSAVAASLERIYTHTDTASGGTGNSTPRQYLIYDSISADDAAGTVTIVCPVSTANLPGILAYPYFSIIDVTVADQVIIGTGPYRMVEATPGVSMELARNDLYWKTSVPYDTVTLLYIEDSSTKAMAIQSGNIDLVENITTASDLEKLMADNGYSVSVAAGARTGNTYFNYNGLLADKTLRQAVIMALDNDTMCNLTVAGMYTPGISVLPSSLAYNYDKLSTPYSFNPQAAVNLLDAAGIVDTDGDGWRELNGTVIELDYVTYNSRNLNEFAEAVALQLSDIGIKVNVSVRDYDTALALVNAGEFDMVTSNAVTVGVGDPQDYLATWYTAGSASWGNYSNPEFDAVYEALMVEADSGRRIELITQLQQILIDDAATIVHGYYNSTMISNAARITGAEIATIDYYWLTTDIKPVG